MVADKELSEYINGLKEEIAFWKKWAMEYLTNYPLYSDEFLETLESIEGKDSVEKIKMKRDEIIDILKSEGVWKELEE